MSIKLSILDQSPIFERETPYEAFQHTLELAQLAEEQGYYRFWVSEHHDSDRVAGSSPEVLISHILAKTSKIRVGSGGVMLQHYSPYKVAENFNVLASLAPGRVDLGIGRAPGGLPRSTRALQQQSQNEIPLEKKLEELLHYLAGPLTDEHTLSGLRANPIPETPAEVFLLGASKSSADLAVKQDLPYVFAQFINSDPLIAKGALTHYQEEFQKKKGFSPRTLFAISVIVAETEEEANALAQEYKLIKVHLKSGKTLTLGSIEQAEEFARQAQEPYEIEEQQARIIKGTKESVREQILDLQINYSIDEFIVTTSLSDFNKRLRSYILLKEALLEPVLESPQEI